MNQTKLDDHDENQILSVIFVILCNLFQVMSLINVISNADATLGVFHARHTRVRRVKIGKPH